MKRLIALLLAILMLFSLVFMLASCATEECMICDEACSKRFKVKLFGQEGYLCKDCNADIQEIKDLAK